MIKTISNKIAEYIAKDDETADVEVIAYGYDLLLQEICVIVVSLVVGIILGIAIQVLLSILVYNTLRMYIGGVHANHRVVCLFSSIIIMFGPSLLFAQTSLFFSGLAYPFIYMFCFVMLILYAPADTETQPIRNLETRKNMKQKAILTLTLLFVVAVVINVWRPNYASTILAIIVIVSIFTHPIIYRLFGCKKSTPNNNK